MNTSKTFQLKSSETIIRPMHPDASSAFLQNGPESENFYPEDFNLSEAFEPAAQNIAKSEKLLSIKDGNYLWYVCWCIYHIEKDKSETPIGYLFFHGEPELGEVTISIYLSKFKKNLGYGTDALKIISDWAFTHDNCYIINAKMSDENDSALNAFSKAGFVFRSAEHHIESYSKTKSPSSMKGVYMMIGIWAGLGIGILLGQIVPGFVIGILIGFMIGTGFEMKEKQHKAAVLGRK